MYISALELFSVGIGPSSSHTVGPMRCAGHFIRAKADLIGQADTIYAELYGSLALTGMGHATDKAVIIGLSGGRPETILPEDADNLYQQAKINGQITVLGKLFEFVQGKQLLFRMNEFLPFHANGMKFKLYGGEQCLAEEKYYSVGGGFFLTGAEALSAKNTGGETADKEARCVPYPFDNAEQLLELCRKSGLGIPMLMMENENALRPEKETTAQLCHIWDVMNDCIERSTSTEGILPGGLNVKRWASRLLKALEDERASGDVEPASVKDWISLYALAVNEENAAGGRVVTAPTNGAAGIIPAVFRYYLDFVRGAQREHAVNYLLTAAAVGNLYKNNASISAAEVGCQGEIGVACSMAAAGLTQLRGGSPEQIENAAEIAMEHNLGLTCDPIGGLVQIPCIERNTIGANTAVTAARLALRGDGTHVVGLDKVIRTMFITGKEMSAKYKETAQGGLAVNFTEC
ncbi:hypothetical protein CHS0354_035234 [Potamilus streckersoni]|uniref:L-serine ammonia-lyase n=1 Tax=Potamilus streckersoni TaxID=2493646 RepID=A0AAE0S2U4_9BIVA|nr:hypothetical protein CHS0354_035234 [Potamilus streckersoni]